MSRWSEAATPAKPVAHSSASCMSPKSRLRAAYVASALATTAIGLVVHFGGTRLPLAARDVVGDALWALTLTWWISALVPQLARSTRAALTFGFCCAVELSQLYHTPGLDALRRTTLGHLVLGSGFDLRDLAAYSLGILGAVFIERSAALRKSRYL